jgi:hypothetical protein
MLVDAPPAPSEASRARSAFFATWFAGSTVVDPHGAPLVVFHGTTASFDEFSHDMIGEGNGNGDWGDGFYFTDNPMVASGYAQGEGGNVIPVYLDIKRPADRNVMLSRRVQLAMDDGMGFESVHDVLQHMGYDGVVIDHGADGREFVVFRPEQIKSAVHVRGEEMPRKPVTNCSPAFAKWFGASQVVDAQGLPAVVYHGTNVDFQAFDRSHLGSNSEHPSAQLGFFFSTDPASVEAWTWFGQPNIRPVYLAISNPLRMTGAEFRSMVAEDLTCTEQESAVQDRLRRVRDQGNDGIFVSRIPAASDVDAEWAGDVWIALDPRQVKSALGNNGQFDAHDARMCFSIGQEAVASKPSPSRVENDVRRVRAAVAQMVGQLPGQLQEGPGGVVVSTSAHAVPSVAFASRAMRTAQGWFDGKSRTTVLIADRIPIGMERAVFMHECVHKHGRRALGADRWEQLLQVPLAWARRPIGTLERTIHDKAFVRAVAAGVHDPRFSEELLAYSVEIAINLGVRPSATATEGSASRWLFTVVSALATVLEKLGLKTPAEISAREAVDLAYALAQLENPDRTQRIRRALELGDEVAAMSGTLGLTDSSPGNKEFIPNSIEGQEIRAARSDFVRQNSH